MSTKTFESLALLLKVSNLMDRDSLLKIAA